MHRAAYNSRIDSHNPGMPTQRSSQFVTSLLTVAAFLFAVPGNAQNRAGAEEQLAGKIVSVSGSKTMVLEVSNRSSLNAATADDIRRNLLTQLAAKGARFVPAGQAAASVRVSLSEDLQSYVWIAEIRQGGNASSVVMVALPRAASLSVEPAAAAVVLHRVSLWSQAERILDVAVVEGDPARMLVLDGDHVTFYRLQDNRWQPEESLPVVHSRPWPRDLRGRLLPAKDKDHLFDAYLPGVHCRGSGGGVPSAMMCYDSDDPWPLGNDLSNLNAAFTAARNFFSGAWSPGAGKQTTTPAFYSAAFVPREQSGWWLLATVDGQVHLLDGSTDQVLEKLDWGSDIAGLHSGCGSGAQVLATARGDGRNDAVRAFEIAGREPLAASAPLDVNGAITALWTEATGSSAIAVAHNLETGRYEAIRLTLTCGR
jgi:hypothetical protein